MLKTTRHSRCPAVEKKLRASGGEASVTSWRVLSVFTVSRIQYLVNAVQAFGEDVCATNAPCLLRSCGGQSATASSKTVWIAAWTSRARAAQRDCDDLGMNACEIK
jgi:hypothetical protein